MPRPSHPADQFPSPSCTTGASAPDCLKTCPDQGSGLHERPQCWVIAGDLHGNVTFLERIPELPGADGLILTGDLTAQGALTQARAVVEAAQALNPVVLAQIGNMDRPEVNRWLEAEGINLHCKVRELAPQVAIMGVGGSTFTPFGTPSEFPEARFAEWLEGLARYAIGYRSVVLVTHCPPRDTVCDRTTSGIHAGSTAVREFIEEYQPEVCLCGHIHEARGQQLIGRTVVVNPGSPAAGGYALLTLSPEGIRISLRRLED